MFANFVEFLSWVTFLIIVIISGSLLTGYISKVWILKNNEVHPVPQVIISSASKTDPDLPPYLGEDDEGYLADTKALRNRSLQ